MSHLRFVLALFLGALALGAGADSNAVEAVGEAETAKLATQDALRKCVEKIAGVYVESSFSSDQREQSKNDTIRFRSDVRDTLLTHAEGYVEHYDVIETKSDRGIVRVKVRAVVFGSKLESDVHKLAALRKAAGNPTLAINLEEVRIGPNGDLSPLASPVLAPQLEHELTTRGFELKAKSSADMVIGGRIEIRNKGVIEDTGGLDALKGQTRIEITGAIRALDAKGEVLSSKSLSVTSIGTDEQRAINRAFTGKGANAVKVVLDGLLRDLTAAFKKRAEEGRAFVVELAGIKSYAREAERFIAAVKSIEGVASADERSFAKGTIALEVRFKGALGELKRRILDKVKSDKDLGGIDVSGMSGDQLSLAINRAD